METDGCWGKESLMLAALSELGGFKVEYVELGEKSSEEEMGWILSKHFLSTYEIL